MRKAIITAICLVLCQFIGWAQSAVTGTVIDGSDNTPVAGAYVVMQDAEGKTLDGTTTDANGKFRLRPVSNGNRVEISFIGYETISLPIKDV